MIEQPHPGVEIGDTLAIVIEALAAPAQPLALQYQASPFDPAPGAEVRHEVFKEDHQLLAAHAPSESESVLGASGRLLIDDVARPLCLECVDDLPISVCQTGKASREVAALADRDSALTLKHSREPCSVCRRDPGTSRNALLALSETLLLQSRTTRRHGFAMVLSASDWIFMRHNEKYTAIWRPNKLRLTGKMPTFLAIEGPRH